MDPRIFRDDDGGFFSDPTIGLWVTTHVSSCGSGCLERSCKVYTSETKDELGFDAAFKFARAMSLMAAILGFFLFVFMIMTPCYEVPVQHLRPIAGLMIVNGCIVILARTFESGQQ